MTKLCTFERLKILVLCTTPTFFSTGRSLVTFLCGTGAYLHDLAAGMVWQIRRVCWAGRMWPAGHMWAASNVLLMGRDVVHAKDRLAPLLGGPDEGNTRGRGSPIRRRAHHLCAQRHGGPGRALCVSLNFVHCGQLVGCRRSQTRATLRQCCQSASAGSFSNFSYGRSLQTLRRWMATSVWNCT